MGISENVEYPTNFTQDLESQCNLQPTLHARERGIFVFVDSFLL